MARKPRIQYPNAVYYVMSRGNRQNDIFLDDVDRQDFLKTLAEACNKTGWAIHAYCLMNSHFHLVIETPEPNLVEGMRWFLSTYTMRLNNRHKLTGHVFSGRYKTVVVESGNGYLKTACDYVLLNPIRARLLKANERLTSYPWSSLVWYQANPKHRPSWIRVDRLLGEYGIKMDNVEGRRKFEKAMEKRRLKKDDEEIVSVFERGWCCGSEAFRKEMLEGMEGQLGENDSGEIRREIAELRAARIIEEELRRLRWSEADLLKKNKGDPDKKVMAVRLRKETTLTIKWIAARLHLGTSQSANGRLHAWMNEDKAKTSEANKKK